MVDIFYFNIFRINKVIPERGAPNPSRKRAFWLIFMIWNEKKNSDLIENYTFIVRMLTYLFQTLPASS